MLYCILPMTLVIKILIIFMLNTTLALEEHGYHETTTGNNYSPDCHDDMNNSNAIDYVNTIINNKKSGVLDKYQFL